MSSSSYRIGRRRTAAATACSPESGILRSLFELRKRCSDPLYSNAIPQVNELVFFCCEWTQRIVHSLSKLIVRDGNRFTSIKFFDCDVSSPEFLEILSIMMNHNTTTKLVIKGRKMIGNRNESHEQILPRCESSRAAPTLDESFLAAISDGISVQRSLKSLKISGVRIIHNSSDGGDHLWCKRFINNTHLRHLDLSGSYVSLSTIISISSALSLNSTLQSLNLGACSLNDRSLSKVTHSVKEHSSLIELNLSGNFLGKSTSTEALDAVAELMNSKNSKLEYLDLSKQHHPVTSTVTNRVENVSNENETEAKLKFAFTNALHALSSNTTLRRINLSGNDGCFSELHSVEALSSCLASNNTLQHVDISLCYLNPSGLSHLAEKCIPRCSENLKSLVLFGDEMINRSAGFSANWKDAFLSLEKGLRANFIIENLGELGHWVDSKTRCSLEYLLNVNRAGRRALQADDLPLGAWSDILSRASGLEYEIPHNDDKVAPSNTTTSATVLFTLLHGPSTFDRRR